MASDLLTVLEEGVSETVQTPICTRAPNGEFAGLGNVRLSKQCQCILEIDRAAVTGTAAVFGLDVGDPQGNPVTVGGARSADQIKTDGVATVYGTQIPGVALSNNNIIVQLSVGVLTGTVTVTAGSTTVTGSGTSFDTQVLVGQRIVVNGEERVVASITSATVLVTTVAFVAAAAAVTIRLIGRVLIPTTEFTVATTNGLLVVTISAAALAPDGAKMNVYTGTVRTLHAAATTRLKKAQVAAPDFIWTKLLTTPSATSVHLRSL